ncbi:sigma-70 family RNA polymerase sigma factor [Nocardioides sp. Root151]|uniref:sigma-70 family RNA polymerase sigma factor n=1 Tax=Nocardioides sp. Root151 TaxID=1736475 RepID=UPI0007027ABA|nr:sigma-70 family RNA polymerase sigma factor [Nocardioides sp. Root151]KQZ70771.1 hypothetical protein ASD66_14470 [Nocardioides sp. Root151]
MKHRPDRPKDVMTVATRPSAAVLSDQELITLVRGGKLEHFGELFARHGEAARRVASYVGGRSHADDLVSEAFAQILRALQNGKGPDMAFRPYLYTTIRRLHSRRSQQDARQLLTDDFEVFGEHTVIPDDLSSRLENAAVERAFRSLPQRWQAVLWYTVVEGLPLAEAGRHLGLTQNGVAALSFRAREGLRQSYLADHAADTADAHCHDVVSVLPAYVRGVARGTRAGLVERHLPGCRACTAVFLELQQINDNLAALLAPMVLGGAAVAVSPRAWDSTGGFTATVARVVPLVGIVAAGLMIGTTGVLTVVDSVVDEAGASTERWLSNRPDAPLPRAEAGPRTAPPTFLRPERPDERPPWTRIPAAPAQEARTEAGSGETGTSSARRRPPRAPVTPSSRADKVPAAEQLLTALPSAPALPSEPTAPLGPPTTTVDVAVQPLRSSTFVQDGQSWYHVELDVVAAPTTEVTVHVDTSANVEVHAAGRYAVWACNPPTRGSEVVMSCRTSSTPGTQSTLAFDLLLAGQATVTVTSSSPGNDDPNPANDGWAQQLPAP